VKIYVAAVEALREKERQGETQEPSKLIYVSCPLFCIAIATIPKIE
jgi:hypothetical protein